MSLNWEVCPKCRYAYQLVWGDDACPNCDVKAFKAKLFFASGVPDPLAGKTGGELLSHIAALDAAMRNGYPPLKIEIQLDVVTTPFNYSRVAGMLSHAKPRWCRHRCDPLRFRLRWNAKMQEAARSTRGFVASTWRQDWARSVDARYACAESPWYQRDYER